MNQTWSNQGRMDRQQAIIEAECELRRWRAQPGTGKFCRRIKQRIKRLKQRQNNPKICLGERLRDGHNYSIPLWIGA